MSATGRAVPARQNFRSDLIVKFPPAKVKAGVKGLWNSGRHQATVSVWLPCQLSPGPRVAGLPASAASMHTMFL